MRNIAFLYSLDASHWLLLAQSILRDSSSSSAWGSKGLITDAALVYIRIEGLEYKYDPGLECFIGESRHMEAHGSLRESQLPLR